MVAWSTDAPRPTDSYRVIVVGGGPVGMGLALELGHRGVHCVVIERHTSPQPIPKGQNLTQRTMEHFRVWGVEYEVRNARLMPAGYPAGGITAYGTLLSGYHYPWYRRADVRPYYFVDNDRLPQYRTESVLRAAAQSLETVDVRTGWVVEKVEHDVSGVRVTANRPHGEADDTAVFEADYVVGCDGANSVVRRQVGIDQQRSDHERVMALVVFRSGQLNRLVEAFPPTAFFNVLHPDFDGYWQFLGRVDDGEQWFFHAPIPDGLSRHTVDIPAMLHRAVGESFALDIDHLGFWDLRTAIATRYRNDRAFIAGDAAHSHPPYGGFGINTGFEDARNLGWKLAATIDGWGGDSLLASYDQERRPVFESIAKDFIEAFIAADRHFVRTHNPARDLPGFEKAWEERASGANASVHAFAPHYEGSPIVAGPPGGVSSATGSHRFEAIPGHHLVPQPLTSGLPMIDQLGPGFTLLALDAQPEAVGRIQRAAAAMAIPLRTLTDSRAGGRQHYGAPLVLVRPDHFVAWTGAGGDIDPREVLTTAVGASKNG